ncbi:hypothetical protein PWP89_00705 [Stenotrophomonas rhizophila]|jgi:hypothetical protein|uniref:hypothetical protein n=2 Tax=Stenotrophomonas rhizophila TaxID=216778 RepID=UPI003397D409
MMLSLLLAFLASAAFFWKLSIAKGDNDPTMVQNIFRGLAVFSIAESIVVLILMSRN